MSRRLRKSKKAGACISSMSARSVGRGGRSVTSISFLRRGPDRGRRAGRPPPCVVSEKQRQVLDSAMIEDDLPLLQQPSVCSGPFVLPAPDDEPFFGEAAASEQHEVGPDAQKAIA